MVEINIQIMVESQISNMGGKFTLQTTIFYFAIEKHRLTISETDPPFPETVIWDIKLRITKELKVKYSEYNSLAFKLDGMTIKKLSEKSYC